MGVLKNKPGDRTPRLPAKLKVIASPAPAKPVVDKDIEALTDDIARTYPKILARLGE
jgi:hypothetical protein